MEMDKSIAEKWLIAGGIHEASWDENTNKYASPTNVNGLFLGLLTEEESKTGFAKMIQEFSRWSNIDSICESILEKKSANKIYNMDHTGHDLNFLHEKGAKNWEIMWNQKAEWFNAELKEARGE